ncbi:nuclear transport factor 2 family protein [Streptomyces sp. NPDC090442]|uniref:nuclear transport factor 2 family protein n=1 Tax=Streptomyces sp. NPDC090442 TaxID=3365962 RepID=UPI0038167258
MPGTPEETFRRLLDLLLAKDMTPSPTCGRRTAPPRSRSPWGPRHGSWPDGRGSAPIWPATRNGWTCRPYPWSPSIARERPDTIVVEFTADGLTVRTGAPHRLDYIAVITVRDGLIAHYRDYWNPLAAASAAGRLPELLDSLRSKATR